MSCGGFSKAVYTAMHAKDCHPTMNQVVQVGTSIVCSIQYKSVCRRLCVSNSLPKRSSLPIVRQIFSTMDPLVRVQICSEWLPKRGTLPLVNFRISFTRSQVSQVRHAALGAFNTNPFVVGFVRRAHQLCAAPATCKQDDLQNYDNAFESKTCIVGWI